MQIDLTKLAGQASTREPRHGPFPFFRVSKSIAKPSQNDLSWHCIPPLASGFPARDDVHDFTRKENPPERSAGFQNVSATLC
jgi:hypothetical protein